MRPRPPHWALALLAVTALLLVAAQAAGAQGPEVAHASACGTGPLRLVGGDSPFLGSPESVGEDIEVLSDLTVRRDGVTVFDDHDGVPQIPPLQGLAPIVLAGENGDQLEITANTGVTSARFLDPLALVCDDGRRQVLSGGKRDAVSRPNRDFFRETFTIGIGGP